MSSRFTKIAVSLCVILSCTKMAFAGDQHTCLYKVLGGGGYKCDDSLFVFNSTLTQKSADGLQTKGIKGDIWVLDRRIPITNQTWFPDYENKFHMDSSGNGLVGVGKDFEAIEFKLAGVKYRGYLDHLKANSEFDLELLAQKKGAIQKCSGHLSVPSLKQVGTLKILCQ